MPWETPVLHTQNLWSESHDQLFKASCFLRFRHGLLNHKDRQAYQDFFVCAQTSLFVWHCNHSTPEDSRSAAVDCKCVEAKWAKKGFAGSDLKKEKNGGETYCLWIVHYSLVPAVETSSKGLSSWTGTQLQCDIDLFLHCQTLLHWWLYAGR